MAIKYTLIESNWRSLGSYEVLAAFGANNKQIPIAPQEIPISTESRLIAVFIACDNARMTWNWAGFILQKVFSGLSVGGSIDSIYSSKKLYLNQINLIELNQPQSTSTLRFIVPKYFPSWRCIAWEYVGAIEDDIAIIKERIMQGFFSPGSSTQTGEGDDPFGTLI